MRLRSTRDGPDWPHSRTTNAAATPLTDDHLNGRNPADGKRREQWQSRSGRCRGATRVTVARSGRPSRPPWSPARTPRAAPSTCRTVRVASAVSTARGPTVARFSEPGGDVALTTYDELRAALGNPVLEP